jgi:hypothetical protein
MLENIWVVWEFSCCLIILVDYKGLEKVLLLPTIPSVTTHESECVGKDNIRNVCEHKGVFKPF